MNIARYWLFKFTNLTSEYANWEQINENTVLQTAQAYTMKGSGIATPPAIATQNYVFSGKPNNGLINHSGIQIGINNINLIGNPYPSALDADVFLKDNMDVLKGTLYFWTHNTPFANKYISDDYAVYNLLGGVGTRAAMASGENETLPDGKIASAQSFFVQSLIAGEVKFENSMRIMENNSLFFRPSKSTRKRKPSTNNPLT